MPARCVFSETWYAGQSGAGAAVHRPSCAANLPTSRSFLTSLLNSAVAFVAPSQCRLCREHLLLEAKAAPVCADCLAQLQGYRLGICCSLCSEPLGYETSLHAPDDGHLCSKCEEARPAFVRATAFGAYELMGRVLRLFKFEGVRALEVPLGAMLAEAIIALADGMPERLLVVPVPLYRRRRMYNQSHLLARAATRAVRRIHPEWAMDVAPRCMKRIHHREAHYRLSPEERRENVRGAFRVQDDVTGTHVLLVDDVYTTGATVTECTEMLLSAGAASVRVVTLARAGTQTPVLWTPRTAAMVSTEYQVRNGFEQVGNSTLRH